MNSSFNLANNINVNNYTFKIFYSFFADGWRKLKERIFPKNDPIPLLGCLLSGPMGP